jgi:hypothetical protein
LSASGEAANDSYRKESGIHSAEDVAGAVWKFLGAAGSLVDELDKEDDVRLLRLRTKKNELVIVPGEFDRRKYSTPLNKRQTQNSFSSSYTIRRPHRTADSTGIQFQHQAFERYDTPPTQKQQ